MFENRKLKATLAGCGKISKTWLKALVDFDDVEIAGLVDVDEAQVENIKAAFNLNGAVSGASLERVIEESGSGIVFDCTVPSAHKEIAIAALSCGCHVLGEKPMAENMHDASEMLNAAEKSGKIYAVIQNRRYVDKIVEFKNIVRSGKLGKLTALNADFYRPFRGWSFRSEMRHVLLLDMAIHSFDQARFISGKDPVSVYCHEWNPEGSWFKHGASATAIFEMSDGVVFCYRGSWCSNGLDGSWQCEWRANCTEGSASWDGEDALNAEKVAADADGKELESSRLEFPEIRLEKHGHAGVMREFIDCAREGKAPQTVCSDNIKSLAMVHAAIESAESGKKVSIEY